MGAPQNLQANITAWSGNTLPRAIKFKSVPSASKVMLMWFWDFNRFILEHYQDCRLMVSNAQYCAMLEEQLKPTIHSKCRGVPTKELFCMTTTINLIQQQCTAEMIQKLKFKLLPSWSRSCPV
jgi:hypothetical protein